MKELKASEPFQPCMLCDATLIPDAILKDPTLSAGARLLWGMFVEYQGKSVECFPSQEMLAGFLGVKVRQLQSYIKELENYTRGDPPELVPLIGVKRVWVGKGRQNRNIYNLLWQPFLAVNGMANGAEEGHLADGDDALYFACRSRGDTQAAQPAILGKDGGLTPDGAPPDDTQSSARRSEGDMQNATAAAGPAALGREGGAGLPEDAPEDRVAPAMYANPQHLLQQQAQPLAPVLNRYANRPLGPGDCTPHSSTQSCKNCGATVEPVHMMIRLISGFFCERCCPACHPGG